MQQDPRSRTDAVHRPYLPQEEAARQQQQRAAQPTPSVTITSPIEEAGLRRPLHLGIATAAANTAARTAAQRPQQQQQAFPAQTQQQTQSRVQQKLQRNNGPPSPRNGPSPPFPLAMPNVLPGGRNMMPSQEHVPQQQQQQMQQRGAPVPRQAGPNGMRPFELRADSHHQPQYPQQQMQASHGNEGQGRRPALPVLQVTVPQQAYQAPQHGRPQVPLHHQQLPNSQRHGPPSPFSSSTETLVGTPHEKNKYAGNGKPPPNWSPSSSASSSSHTYNNNQHAPPSPAFARNNSNNNNPYGNNGPPSPSPSIKNLQLQIPSNDDHLAHPDNDRLSPAMPREGLDQRDWWKRFSHVIKENEVKEQLAEKSGSKGSKVQRCVL